MPASTFTGPAGSVSRRPGVRGRIDASALNRVGQGVRRVALVGEAEGGVPVTVLESGAPAVRVASSPGGVASLFRAGALRLAGLLSFRASRDENVPNAPAEVLFCKVNPATQAQAILASDAGDALVIKSRDYAEFSNRITIDLQAGTTRGFKAVVRLEAQSETLDDIGGDPVLEVHYPTAGQAATMALTKTASAVSAAFTFTHTAASGNIVEDAHVAGQVARVKSGNAYDTHQTVTVYGTDATDAPVTDRIKLNGTTVVSGTQAFKTITGVRVDAATAGLITVDEPTLTNVAFAVPATLTATHTTGEAAQVVSNDAADIGQRITVFGIDAAGQKISEALVLNGTSAVTGAKAFHKITAAVLSAVCAGTVTVKSATSAETAFSLAAGALDAGLYVGKGLVFARTLPVDGVLAAILAAAPDATPFIVLRGRDATGAAKAERVVVSDSSASSTTSWSSLDHIEVGMLEDGDALTLSGAAFTATVAKVPTVAALVSLVNGKPGFTCTAVAADASSRRVVDLDNVSALNVRSNTAVALKADLQALVDTIAARSSLVTATAASGAYAPPNLTGGPVFLVGGSEGTTKAADWQAAFDALRSYEDVIIVPLTTDAAVHVQLDRHLRAMESDIVGANARQGYVGLSGSLDQAGIKAAIRTLDNRNLCAVAQDVLVYDESNKPTWVGPQYLAAMAAAMQAGSGFAEPLTWKSLDALAVRQHVSWSPREHVETMLEAGLMFLQWADGRGAFQWERSITTFRDTNLVFGEMSANESANFSRNRAEKSLNAIIGRPGFGGTAGTIRSLLLAELAAQVQDGVINAFDEATVEVTRLGDGYNAAYSAEPVLPVNFVGLTARMVPLTFAVAA